MKKLAVLGAAVAVAVFATTALSGNAGVKRAAREQARTATLQQQVNELRSELICVEAVTGNGVAQDLYAARSAISSPTPDSSIDEHGVCKKLGVTLPGTTPDGAVSPALRRLIARAVGR